MSCVTSRDTHSAFKTACHICSAGSSQHHIWPPCMWSTLGSGIRHHDCRLQSQPISEVFSAKCSIGTSVHRYKRDLRECDSGLIDCLHPPVYIQSWHSLNACNLWLESLAMDRLLHDAAKSMRNRKRRGTGHMSRVVRAPACVSGASFMFRCRRTCNAAPAE